MTDTAISPAVDARGTKGVELRGFTKREIMWIPTLMLERIGAVKPLTHVKQLSAVLCDIIPDGPRTSVTPAKIYDHMPGLTGPTDLRIAAVYVPAGSVNGMVAICFTDLSIFIATCGADDSALEAAKDFVFAAIRAVHPCLA